MNATIEKLTIKLGTRDIELTLEEAHALQTELNLCLSYTRVFPYIPIYIDRVILQLPQPFQPYYGPTCSPFPQTTWGTPFTGAQGNLGICQVQNVQMGAFGARLSATS